jgi:tetratricopeptide (TPR) repeat protein
MTHEEAERIFTEAEAMASAAGDMNTRALVLASYAALRGINDGDGPAMAELGSRALALAEESEDPALYMAIAGNSYGYFLVGEHRRAVAVVDRAMELADHDPDVSAVGSVVCPYGWALIFKGGYRVALGEFGGNQELFERGIELCREKGDIESIGWGHMWWFWHCYHAGEPAPALAHAQQALDFSDRLGSAFSQIFSRAFFGGALMSQGRWSEAIESLETALAMSGELQTGVDSTFWARLWLAEAYAGIGDVERGVELARRTLEEATDHGLAYAEAGGHLLLARLLLAASGSETMEEVESELAIAGEQAERMEFRPIEGLVRVEIARLARARGEEAAHLEGLREAYELFTEIGAAGHAERLASELAAAPGKEPQL